MENEEETGFFNQLKKDAAENRKKFIDDVNAQSKAMGAAWDEEYRSRAAQMRVDRERAFAGAKAFFDARDNLMRSFDGNQWAVGKYAFREDVPEEERMRVTANYAAAANNLGRILAQGYETERFDAGEFGGARIVEEDDGDALIELDFGDGYQRAFSLSHLRETLKSHGIVEGDAARPEIPVAENDGRATDAAMDRELKFLERLSRLPKSAARAFLANNADYADLGEKYGALWEGGDEEDVPASGSGARGGADAGASQGELSALREIIQDKSGAFGEERRKEAASRLAAIAGLGQVDSRTDDQILADALAAPRAESGSEADGGAIDERLEAVRRREISEGNLAGDDGIIRVPVRDKDGKAKTRFDKGTGERVPVTTDIDPKKAISSLERHAEPSKISRLFGGGWKETEDGDAKITFSATGEEADMLKTVLAKTGAEMKAGAPIEGTGELQTDFTITKSQLREAVEALGNGRLPGTPDQMEISRAMFADRDREERVASARMANESRAAEEEERKRKAKADDEKRKAEERLRWELARSRAVADAAAKVAPAERRGKARTGIFVKGKEWKAEQRR